jgi:hypothetical protein
LSRRPLVFRLLSLLLELSQRDLEKRGLMLAALTAMIPTN